MLNLINQITRWIQISLCVASLVLVFTYAPGRTGESSYVLTTWLQLAIGFLTVPWLSYIMIAPLFGQGKSTNGIATACVELFYNALWLVYWVVPVTEPRLEIGSGFDQIKSISCLGSVNACTRQSTDPVLLGVAISAWGTFMITSCLILISAWPLMRVKKLRRSRCRVGGILFDPDVQEESEVRVSGDTLTDTQYKYTNVRTEQV